MIFHFKTEQFWWIKYWELPKGAPLFIHAAIGNSLQETVHPGNLYFLNSPLLKQFIFGDGFSREVARATFSSLWQNLLISKKKTSKSKVKEQNILVTEWPRDTFYMERGWGGGRNRITPLPSRPLTTVF